MLNEFIQLHREEIIARCRERVAQRSVPTPTQNEIDHGVPMFLDQLVIALGTDSTARRDSGISESAVLHGRYLFSQGFTVSQVVHDYGDVCQSITDLAILRHAPFTTEEFRTLNRCLDDAIAGAVTEFGRGRNHSAVDGEAERGTERLGFLTHELRNLMNTALFAFEVMKQGDVGVAGTTGRVLNRSLVAARDLIARSLAEVRLSQGIQSFEPILVSGFIEDVVASAALEAQSRMIGLVVLPIEAGVLIEGDRQVLASVVVNLLQNAFKFTKPNTTVTLRVGATAERVLIEVEDACGGLPGNGGTEVLFRPFEQRSTDRTGVGLGLAFCRWGVDANNGRLYTRNLPDHGCIFTLNLPRLAAPQPVITPPVATA